MDGMRTVITINSSARGEEDGSDGNELSSIHIAMKMDDSNARSYELEREWRMLE